MVVLILVFLAGIFKAIQDTILFHYSTSILPRGDFWNQEVSWKLKYKNYPVDQSARFFGSKTFLVFLTDGFHLAQFFFLNLMIAAMVCYEPIVNTWVDFVILGVVMKTVFELFYSKILIKKEQK